MNASTLPKLYQYQACPFCAKVRTILAYKRIQFETIEVHPLNKKEIRFSKDYKKVPIFIDKDGHQVNDSTPIMRYIDEHYPDRGVFENEESKRIEEERWIEWSNILVRALPPLIYRNFNDAKVAFDYINQIAKFNRLQKALIKYAGAFVMTRVAKKSANEQGIHDPVLHLKNCLKSWENALGDRSFLGGKKPNGADLCVFGVLESVQNLPAFEIVRNNQKVYEWYQAVQKELLR